MRRVVVRTASRPRFSGAGCTTVAMRTSLPCTIPAARSPARTATPPATGRRLPSSHCSMRVRSARTTLPATVWSPANRYTTVPVQRQIARAEHAVDELSKRPRFAPAMGFQVADQLRQRRRPDRQQRFAYVVRREPDARTPGPRLASPPCVWLQVDSRVRVPARPAARSRHRPSPRGRGQGEPPGGGSLENAAHSPGRAWRRFAWTLRGRLGAVSRPGTGRPRPANRSVTTGVVP